MTKEAKTIAMQFDEKAIGQARERFGYVESDKQYKILDLCEALLPGRSPDAAARAVRKEVRAIHDEQGVTAPSGQYKFTAEEAAALSLLIEAKWSGEAEQAQPVAEPGSAKTADVAADKQPVETAESSDAPAEPVPVPESKDQSESDGQGQPKSKKTVAPESGQQQGSASAAPAEGAHAKRQIRGSVVSKSGSKSIVVLVERKVKHPLYKKYIKRSNKLHAHDEHDESVVGDVVSIESCRPVSKTKSWRLVKVVSHVQ